MHQRPSLKLFMDTAFLTNKTRLHLYLKRLLKRILKKVCNFVQLLLKKTVNQNKKKTPRTLNSLVSLCLFLNVLRGIRTPDRRLRRPLLYPAELSGQMALFFQQPNTILCLNCLFVNGFL